MISESLGIALSDFFEVAQECPRPDYVLTRAKDRSCEAPLSAGGYTYRLTSGDLEGEQVSAFELVYPAGETMHPEVLTHRGEEVLYLLEGTMEFRIGSDTMVLEPGDCVHFARDQPHTGENIGPGEARLLMVVSPSTPSTYRLPECPPATPPRPVALPSSQAGSSATGACL